MKRTTPLTGALTIAVVFAFASPALANRDPGFGGMYGPMPPRVGQAGVGGQYTDGMNLYQYVRSNPVRHVDPTGLMVGKGKYCECGKSDNRWRSRQAGIPPVKHVELQMNYLHGFSGGGDPGAKADEVYNQCCIIITYPTVAVWGEELTKKTIGDDLTLDEFTQVGKPTPEELALTKEPFGQGAGLIPAYFVKSLSKGSTGESFPASVFASPPSPAIVVSNAGNALTLAHELGHVLLNPGPHSSDPKNLMYGFRSNTKEELTEAQCDKIRSSPLVK